MLCDFTKVKCVEMDVNQQRAMHKKLTDEKMLQIDFQEHQFLQELQKAREDYRQQQLSQ